MRIKIKYILDNENWTDEQYDTAQDVNNEFEITEDMIIDLIYQNSNLDKGDYIDAVYFVGKE